MWMSSVPLTASIASGPKAPDVSVISRYRGQSRRLRRLRSVDVVVPGHETEDPLRAVAELEHERDVERDEVAEPRRIETARRVREADVDDASRHVRPPRVDGPVGEREVVGQVAEEVERQRRRPEELGPQSLVVEALVRFDEGRSRSCSVERVRGDEGRAGFLRVVERETAPDGSRGPGVGSRGNRL